MIEKELLYKKQNTNDFRIYEVFLTDRGQKMLDQIYDDVIAFANPIFAEFTDESFQELKRSLENMSKVCGL